MTKNAKDKIFQVQRWVDYLGGFIEQTKNFWVRLGNLESKFLKEEISQVQIEKPIYVSGLARSGTTILLEILSRHRGVVSYQYKDYPPVYTPFWWNWLLARMLTQKVKPTERAHRDGILVTPDSPEAMEEILWMTFFPNVHNPKTSNILNQSTNNLEFENFYPKNIQKLLLVRNGNRYLAKGNYNITRLEYILKLFPDARFVIPIRHPVSHIASLIKQHALFCEGERESPRALKHLQRIGHFEFGLDIRPINIGDETKEIMTLWENKQDVKAWSIYWNQIHGYIADRLEDNPNLRKASMVIRFEDFCDSPKETLNALMNHCCLEEGQEVVREFAGKIKSPSYYKPHFSDEELNTIKQETSQTIRRFDKLSGKSSN
jgi:hypothetical protein